ncbi:MAG TPA: hypothetical protein VFQ45_01570 [Longimicrobium sp.]|nr:hypothetical protein [Longimicrobium sp.]
MDKDRVDIIQKHMEALRTELLTTIESQHQIWRLTIIGLAAVLIFSPSVDPASLFPVVPVVAAAVLAYWLVSSHLIFRSGYFLAHAEQRLNDAVGTTLIDHEVPLWQGRVATLKRYLAPAYVVWVITVVALGSMLQTLLAYGNRQRRTGEFNLLTAPGAEVLIWALFTVAVIVGTHAMWRLFGLRRLQIPS